MAPGVEGPGGRAGGIHDGHRKRVKAEFLARGLEGMSDHRVLELLLFYTRPQGDVNPLAHTLISRFGSLSGVFNATYEQLLAVKGVGENTATLIKLVPALGGRYLQDRVDLEQVFHHTWQLRELMEPCFFGARNEMVYLACFDGKHKLIACRKLSEGVVDAASVTTRQVLAAALECNATRVVLAHNHVSGIATPSAEDIMTTRHLMDTLRSVGIGLWDHLIVVDGDMVSMRESGYLEGR